MAQARVCQFVVLCPQCGHWLRFTQRIGRVALGDVFYADRETKASESSSEPIEVPVICSRCEHEFVVDSFRV